MYVFSLFVFLVFIISLLALSTENSSMNTWAGTRPSYSSKQMKTGSRARNMSDYVSVSCRSLQTDLSQYYLKGVIRQWSLDFFMFWPRS